jgi:CHAT domain
MRRKPLVLYLENDPGAFGVMRNWVESLDCEFDYCVSLTQLRKKWKTRRPDVVLLDVFPSPVELTSLIEFWLPHNPELSNAKVIVYSGAEPSVQAYIEEKKISFWSKTIKDFPDRLSKIIQTLPLYHVNECEDVLTVNVIPGQKVHAFLASNPDDQRRARAPFDFDLEFHRSTMDSVLAGPKWIELVKGHGKDLFNDIFDSPISTIYGEASRKCGTASQLRLRFVTPEEHSRSYFEALYDPNSRNGSQFLSQVHPLSCRISNIQGTNRRLSRQRFNTELREIKVLLVAANVHDQRLQRIPGVELEVERLNVAIPESFKEAGITAKTEVLPSSQATEENFEAKVKERFDIIHFAGHGIHRAGSLHETGIYLWSPGNAPSPVLYDCVHLRNLMQDSGCSLVFLNSCYGGDSVGPVDGSRSLLLGVAHTLLQSAVGSVIVHRGVVDDDIAASFAENFYLGLAEMGEPDLAMNRARTKGYSDTSKVWLSAILFDQV